MTSLTCFGFFFILFNLFYSSLQTYKNMSNKIEIFENLSVYFLDSHTMYIETWDLSRIPDGLWWRLNQQIYKLKDCMITYLMYDNICEKDFTRIEIHVRHV